MMEPLQLSASLEDYIEAIYHIVTEKQVARGKDISTTEFATFFIRACRDCAMKNSQGACKSIPDVFMSFINPLIAEEFVQYISEHYFAGAETGR